MQIFITVIILAFIIMTHILVWKWVAYLQEKYATDEKKGSRIMFGIMMLLAALFALLAFVMIQTST
ncbi:hypothetical protein [uncultured Planococcus sp.]|uniref:hypothetical protein n=1 Tax=uncultured Planococcus sp. TaxID=337815 RepID=UPI002608B079|nr:hypothetical protein [uncultured Planococcus sp.]